MRIQNEDLPSVFDDGDIYDLMLAEIPYGLDYYTRLGLGTSGPVLDVACGTGRILLPLLRQGVDIEGVDLYQPMLSRLRKKAAAQGLSPSLHCADMSSFRLARKFSLIMIPFNAFIHNLTQASQISCLQTCRDHLEPGGQLVFDTFFPAVEIVSAAVGTRVLEGELPHPETGLPMRMYDTRTFDRVAQTQHSICELEFLDANGIVSRVYRSQILSRYLYKNEMELLMRVAGFKRWEIYGDFERSPLERENQAMIVSGWRN